MTGAALGSVSQLWRYAASSLAGERRDAISVGTTTVDGDRLFGLVDASDGEIARPDRGPKWHKVPLIRTRSGPSTRLTSVDRRGSARPDARTTDERPVFR